jgi:predicted nucleic acid-binding protein
MAERLLIDTDVLIDYLRDQAEAVSYLESLTEPLLISAITVAELYAGVRDGMERAALDAFIRAFEIATVDEYNRSLPKGLMLSETSQAIRSDYPITCLSSSFII